MQKPLADGLILRSLSEGYMSDREQLPEIYADVNCEGQSERIKEAVRQWTRDLMDGHPTVTLDDIFVVVDPAHDQRVVSAALLIPQMWQYEHIPLAVGRPESVATYPEYRRRGLVRALMEAVHERGAALGHHMQVITGIFHFYRQFGYAQAVALADHVSYPLARLEPPEADYQPAFTLRPASHNDLPNIMRWHEQMSKQRLLTEVKSPEVWRYELGGRRKDSLQALDYLMIVNAAGQAVGYLECSHFQWDKHVLNSSAYVVGDEASYLETYDDVMQGIRMWALATYGACPIELSFGYGIHETLTHLINRTAGGYIHPRDYAWYVRVPEVIPFLKHIQPVLEHRLENSGAHRYTGELRIGFYDLTGICFHFERGQIVDITSMTGKDGYDVSFPWHLFLNVVFGHRQADDIRAILPEVWANRKGAVLLEILFPKKLSWLKGLT